MKTLYVRTLQLLVDLAIAAGALAAAYLIRFEGNLPEQTFKQLAFLLPYVVLARLTSNQITGVYRVAWRYVGVRDLKTFVIAALAPSLLFVALRLGLPDHLHYGRIPLGIIAIDLMLAFLLTFGARTARRMVFEARELRRRTPDRAETRPVILIGAGRAGFIVSREIASRPDLGLRLVGFVDDDPWKRGQTVNGFRVLGTTADLPRLCRDHEVKQVVISIANAPGTDMRRIVALAESIPVRVQIVPGIYELVDGTVKVNRLRDVSLEDLLGRAPVQLDMEAIAAFLKGQHILVTGAGGSIGAEMCRQVCRFRPASLILVERYENNLFEIDRELRETFPDVTLVPCVADICDGARMQSVFARHKPAVVIHAAAHKHVPMMEANAGEAVKNNLFGTKAVADLALLHDAAVFVMISTDKAVNPTSVMGATKRAAELYVQSLARRARTRFATVRFGNVLGSVGSVIPIFKEQIARGGPVTVTHPEMKRYFMTIPEAAQLVLQAASMGEGGEIFVLDMGEPVKIVTLAEELIRFSGLTPYEDIDIVFTGVRPGEKLFEEIALDDEALGKTRHPKIYVGRFPPADPAQVDALMQTLGGVVNDAEPAAVRAVLERALGPLDGQDSGAPRAAPPHVN